MDESWEEEYKKQEIEKLNNLTFAVKSLDETMEYIKKSCKPCELCIVNKNKCDINKSYKKIKKAREELDNFRYNLENYIRRGES